MKKIITLLLALAGMVSTASADVVRIYFNPTGHSDWSEAAQYALWVFGADNTTTNPDSWLKLNSADDYYYLDVNTAYKKFLIVRCGNADTQDWSYKQQSEDITINGSRYYTFDGNKWYNGETQIYGISESTYLPTKYYFLGSFSSSSFTAGPELTESDGTYVGTLTGMAGKNFVITKGLYLNSNGGFIDGDDYINWSKVIRPTSSTTLNFETISNASTTTTNSSQNWYINTDIENVTVSVTPNSNIYSVSCTKTLTIGGAGYATWSNDEKYTISGATAYAVKNMGTYAKLTAQEAGIVYPAGTGLVLGGSGEVTISAVASDAATASISNNDLLGSGNNGLAIAAGCYVLYWDGENPSSVGFSITETGTLGAHKAYLPTTNSRSFLAFEEDITGINEVSTATDNGAIFNLQGVRLNKMQKGLNVVNGKKVMVK